MTESGFYAWRGRGRSLREVSHVWLTDLIRRPLVSSPGSHRTSSAGCRYHQAPDPRGDGLRPAVLDVFSRKVVGAGRSTRPKRSPTPFGMPVGIRGPVTYQQP